MKALGHGLYLSTNLFMISSLFFQDSNNDKFVGFLISDGSTNGRCVYEGPRGGRYYMMPSGGKKYLANGTPIKEAKRVDNRFKEI